MTQLLKEVKLFKFFKNKYWTAYLYDSSNTKFKYFEGSLVDCFVKIYGVEDFCLSTPKGHDIDFHFDEYLLPKCYYDTLFFNYMSCLLTRPERDVVISKIRS